MTDRYKKGKKTRRFKIGCFFYNRNEGFFKNEYKIIIFNIQNRFFLPTWM